MHKQNDWRELIREIMEKRLLSQRDIAERLNVTDATVSCILSGRVNPGKKIRLVLLELAGQCGIMTVEGINVKWKPNPRLWDLKRFIKIRKGRELAQIIREFSRLSPEGRKKFMEYAERIAEHENN